MSKKRYTYLKYTLGVVAYLVTLILCYDYGMSVLENRPRSFIDSTQFIVQSITTTGYGEDAPWKHPLMDVLVIITQISGVAIILVVVDIAAREFITQAVNRRAPQETDREFSDHTIVCGCTRSGPAIIDELTRLQEDFIVVTESEETALELENKDVNVLYGEYTIDVLEEAGIKTCSQIVCNIDDERLPGLVLGIRDAYEDVNIIAIVEEHGYTDVLEHAGSNTVISPRQQISDALAERVCPPYIVESAIQLGENIELREIVVDRESEFIGQTIREVGSDIDEETTIVGAWKDGVLNLPPDPDLEIQSNTILLASGPSETLNWLSTLAERQYSLSSRNDAIVVGKGISGTQIKSYLDTHSIGVTTVDTNEAQDPDIVGDATETAVLQDAGVNDADALIITVSDDMTALSVLLLARSLNDSIEIVMRVNNETTIKDAHRGGADYVIAISQIVGRTLAKEIDENTIHDSATKVRIATVSGKHFAGQTIISSQIRSRTNCTVIGIKRGERVLTNMSNVEIISDDELVIAGEDTDISQFNSKYE